MRPLSSLIEPPSAPGIHQGRPPGPDIRERYEPFGAYIDPSLAELDQIGNKPGSGRQRAADLRSKARPVGRDAVQNPYHNHLN